jgi:2-C-methyl-D-erythritol 4-phosphate cytidylyltransferase
MRAAVIIPAAGSGSRTGLKTPKPFLRISGSPLILFSLKAFQRHRSIAIMQPVLSKELLPAFQRRVLDRHPLSKCRPPVTGGRERQDSVFNGLRALPGDLDIVVVHDAARPFVTPAIITAVIAAAARHGAALAAIPAQDTIIKARGGSLMEGTVDRSRLRQVQTPQAFRTTLLREAHERAACDGYRGTDDASLVQRLGKPVRIVPGSSSNFKVTTSDDVALARALANLC